jgi:hypothetical protein
MVAPRNSRPDTSNTLNYFYDNHTLSVDERVLEQLQLNIGFPKRVAVSDIEHGYRVTEILESPFPARCEPNAGLRLLLHLAARAQNTELQVRGGGRRPLPEPLLGLNSVWPSLSRFVRQHEQGLICASSGVNSAQVFADLARTYPDCRLLMLVRRREQLSQLYREIFSLLPDHLRQRHLFRAFDSEEAAQFHNEINERHAIGESLEMPRFAIALAYASADLGVRQTHITLMEDALMCLNENSHWPLISPGGDFRLLGILHSDFDSLATYEQLKVRQVFGFDEISLGANGKVRRHIEQAWFRCALPPPRGESFIRTMPSVGTRQRQTVNTLVAFIRHAPRNDAIKRLAGQLQRGGQLSQRFRRIRRWLDENHIAQPNFSIVVDRMDHAVTLSRDLPGWRILAVPDSNLSGIPRSIRRRISDSDGEVPTQAIVVADAATRLSGEHLDVVIWASGGLYVDIPTHWQYANDETARPLLIVDVFDDFHQVPRHWSAHRRRELQKSGVYPVGVSPSIGRIQNFLTQTRPMGATQ